MLTTTDKMKFDLYQHEIICADVCTAYWGKFEHWSEPMSPELVSLKLEPDRYMHIYGVDHFLEIDRGTEISRVLRDKMTKYRTYSRMLRKPFHVTFVVQDYAKDIELKLIRDPAEKEVARVEKQKKRTNVIRQLALEAECGNMFLYTCQDWIMKHTDNTILGSPTGQVFSFQTIAELYK